MGRAVQGVSQPGVALCAMVNDAAEGGGMHNEEVGSSLEWNSPNRGSLSFSLEANEAPSRIIEGEGSHDMERSLKTVRSLVELGIRSRDCSRGRGRVNVHQREPGCEGFDCKDATSERYESVGTRGSLECVCSLGEGGSSLAQAAHTSQQKFKNKAVRDTRGDVMTLVIGGGGRRGLRWLRKLLT